MNVDKALASIKDFIEKGERESIVGKLGNVEEVTYKRFHSLLLWSLSLQKYLNEELSTVAREAVADASTCYLLFFHNFYKASLLSLRSSIENAVRLTCLASGVDVKDIATVPQLFSEARGLNRFDGLSTSIVNKLYMHYADLCNFVHSSSPDYMSLKIPFKEMSRADDSRANDTIIHIESTFFLLSQLFFVFFSPSIKSLDHKASDFLLDSLPKSIKKQVNA